MSLRLVKRDRGDGAPASCVAIDTIARKVEHDKATCRLMDDTALNLAPGIAIV
jgi:hypothetical protein